MILDPRGFRGDGRGLILGAGEVGDRNGGLILGGDGIGVPSGPLILGAGWAGDGKWRFDSRQKRDRRPGGGLILGGGVGEVV